MTGIYSKRLASGNQLQVVTATVPAGYRWVIKTLAAYNNDVAATTAALNIAGSRVWQRSVPAVSAVLESNVTLVANPGEVIQLVSGNTLSNMSAHGFELPVS